MRHKGIDKEETRRKIVAAASQGFRKHGYGGIGVDGLAKSAGVTSGAFYSHLGSKDGAFNIALTAGLDEVIDSLPKLQKKHGAAWVEAFAEYYLSKHHRGDLESGCAMATLTPEVVRFGDEMHEIFEKKMFVIVDLIAQGLAGDSDEICHSRAWSMLGILIGGINIARGMKSTKASETVADAIKIAAINSAGKTLAVKS
ncbi:MAG: TetR/AcrR family transcriptional regulator [Gammaproteobacteria bacterium]